jgi:NAD(P)-dependent dehydrogenase (short-subunit alcohol dehydrogenase family)
MIDQLTIFDFTGKVALITGAGRGIGRSSAIAIAQMGADVAVVSRTQSEIDEVVAAITKAKRRGLGIIGIICDLSQRGAPGHVIDTTIAQFGRLDILINNAGQVVRKKAEDTLFEDWDKVLQLNVKAMAEMCRLVLPHLRKNPGTNIINVSSVTGLVGTPLRAAYASTKMAILGYTRVLAKELASEGIRVNAVLPGVIATGFVLPYLNERPQAKAEMLSHIPLKRLGTPDEVAWPIVFLASSAAAYIIGQTIIIDGGWTLF